MTRPKQDTELAHIADAVRALEALAPDRVVAVLDYINSRFLTPPMIHDDECDECERAPWPHELEPGGSEP